jgi:menaquinol-cytochrome c reductase iron-sulfur subunit
MSDPSTGKEAAAERPEGDIPKHLTRRQMLLTVAGVALNAIAGVLFAAPIIGYLLAPAGRRQIKKDLEWLSLGELTQFPAGETRLATYRNPDVRPWDGDTGNIPCWVRCISAGQFQVFAINCAHLGCPVRWFPQSGLFMCPCHGGAYYADGARASGPPPRGLFQYDYKIQNDQLWIKAGQMPTLANPPSMADTDQSQGCSCA